jgi:hypothetical protein
MPSFAGDGFVPADLCVDLVKDWKSGSELSMTIKILIGTSGVNRHHLDQLTAVLRRLRITADRGACMCCSQSTMIL